MSDAHGDAEVAIQALVSSYAGALDARDARWLRSLFVDDAVLETVWRGRVRPPARLEGVDEVVSVLDVLARWTATRHDVGRGSYHLAGDGQEATGEVPCTAHHLDPVGLDHVMWITYRDRYRRQLGTWRFAARTIVIEREERRTVSGPREGAG